MSQTIANLVYHSISDPPDSHIPQHQFDAKPVMMGVDRSLKIPLFLALHQLETPYHGFLPHILIYAPSRSLGMSVRSKAWPLIFKIFLQ